MTSRKKYTTELNKQRKALRYELIADAHDDGGLSHQEIANILGLDRSRIIHIVNTVRKERESTS